MGGAADFDARSAGKVAPHRFFQLFIATVRELAELATPQRERVVALIASGVAPVLESL
jgi:hypothetical protein